jgi:hypothetical protein
MTTPAWEIRFTEEYYPAYEAALRKQGTYYIQPKFDDMMRFLRFVDAYVTAQAKPMQDGQHQPVVAPEPVGGAGDKPVKSRYGANSKAGGR